MVCRLRRRVGTCDAGFQGQASGRVVTSCRNFPVVRSVGVGATYKLTSKAGTRTRVQGDLGFRV